MDIENGQKRHRAPKPILLGLEYEKYGNHIPNLENFGKMRKMLTKKLGRMALALFQTSSRSSQMKQNRFGIKFKNTVTMQSQSKWCSDFLN